MRSRHSKTGRNDPCPCGSGRKYKKCCLHRAAESSRASGHYFRAKGKTAEELLHDLATRTFLREWCFLNPMRVKGKELCDLLVLFGDIAIIWMVKNLKLGKNGLYKKSAVEKNTRQLIGARRTLVNSSSPLELVSPRGTKVKVDCSKIREVFLISALLGEGQEFFSGFEVVKSVPIHTFDREFTQIVLNELDTVSDFVQYLRAKEALYRREVSIVINGGEQELLAHYILDGRKLDKFNEPDLVVIDEGTWAAIEQRPEYKAKKKEDEISYLWDGLIDRVYEEGKDYERVAREMARSDRFERRLLAKVFGNARLKAHRDGSRGAFRRLVRVRSVVYCFLLCNEDWPRDERKAMLEAMCYIARGKVQDVSRVVGIATEKALKPECSYDFMLLEKPTWTEEDERIAARLQEETGIFASPEVYNIHEDEYPEYEIT